MYLVNNSLFLFVIVCAAAHSSAQDDNIFRSDYTFDEKLEGWTKLHLVPLPWHEARRKCAAEGAVLASPINEDFLSTFMWYIRNYSSVHTMFTGTHNIFSDKEYYSLDGTDMSRMLPKIITQLTFTETYNSGYNCMVINNNNEFRTDPCVTPYPYLCYRKKYKNVPYNKLCGTTDLDYEFVDSTGSCYKFHNEDVDWKRAFETCVAEGGYLAIPNSARAADLLATLVENNTSQVDNDFMNDNAFIGVTDWEKNGEWYTIHGDLLILNYNQWSRIAGNFAGENFCAAIDKNAQLMKMSCFREKRAFICEKDPKSLL